MRKITHLIVMIASLFVVVFATNAQVSEERTGYILHLAKAGVITPLEEDRYLMMLSNTADFNAVVLVEPELFLFNYSLSDFVGDWENANSIESLVANALLEIDNMAIQVEITVATSGYDLLENTFSYEVRFVGELPESWVDKKGELLQEITFERATLAIDVNEEITAALRAGQEQRLSSTRGGSANPPFP
ncbi:MAG: hypothetical protein MUE54_05020 [Anaerolineae bacterium]|nr:hypothetical protein [Anaerolineae bacterium]